MKKRKIPRRKSVLLRAWKSAWPVIVTAAVKIAFDVAVAALTVQPALEQLPQVILV